MHNLLDYLLLDYAYCVVWCEAESIPMKLGFLYVFLMVKNLNEYLKQYSDNVVIIKEACVD